MVHIVACEIYISKLSMNLQTVFEVFDEVCFAAEFPVKFLRHDPLFRSAYKLLHVFLVILCSLIMIISKLFKLL